MWDGNACFVDTPFHRHSVAWSLLLEGEYKHGAENTLLMGEGSDACSLLLGDGSWRYSGYKEHPMAIAFARKTRTTRRSLQDDQTDAGKAAAPAWRNGIMRFAKATNTYCNFP